ncbi:recombinase family protein [Actinokineospora sp. NPDC004072]
MRRKFRKQLSDKATVVVPFTPDGDASLCYIRQSHYSDESMSSATQKTDTHRWSNAYGISIAETVEDLHVSGDLDPFKRDGLKEWLSDAPPRPWKTLVVSKLDRLVRNVMDALALLEWLRARGKRLICIAEGIDSSNSMSEFLITLIVAFARMERERMRERFLRAKADLKLAGRWAGEGHTYGTMPVEVPGGGWILGLDQYAVKILHQLSEQARRGVNLADMCRWLDEHHVVSPRDRQLQLSAERRGEDPATVELSGRKWRASTLRKLLGRPELVELGIFEPAEQSEIVANLDAKTRRKSRGSNQPYPFSGILVCSECLEPLWHRIAASTRRRPNGSEVTYEYNYWCCPTRKHGPSMRAEEIEPLAEQTFYTVFALVPVRERIILPPSNHANEIAKLEREYARLMAGVAKARTPDERHRVMRDGDQILRDIDILRALPADPGGVRWVPTDRTWNEELADLSPEERRLRWIELGFQFAVSKNADGSLRGGFRLPDGWEEAMPELLSYRNRITGNAIVPHTYTTPS